VKVILYDEGASGEVAVEEISRYLARKMGRAEVEIKATPLPNLAEDKIFRYAASIAATKIGQIDKKIVSGHVPLPGEIEYEKRRISGRTKAFGVIYDGFYLQGIFGEIIPQEGLDSVHIIFTNRLFATWDEGNKRYHLRTSLYGIPSIISTSGLIEAPAKPRQYYLLKQQYERLGRDLTELKERFKGSFLDYGDRRLTEVAKGYAMQAVFYSLLGDPFCQDKGCRLYNAHWQEELIFAQLESGYEFCRQHTKVLERVGGDSPVFHHT